MREKERKRRREKRRKLTTGIIRYHMLAPWINLQNAG